jgi:hypothetical protein
MGHRIRVVCGVEVQPGLLGILLQQAQPFQATAYPLTDQLNQTPLCQDSCSLSLRHSYNLEGAQREQQWVIHRNEESRC